MSFRKTNVEVFKEQAAQRMKCPNDWTPFGRSCYKMFNQLFQWEEAQRACKNLGSNLAVPNSKDESEFMWEMHKGSDGSTHMWLGCTVGLSGVWTCVGGNQTEYISELSNVAGKSGCFNMFLKTGSWGPITCTKNRFYLCERPKCTVPVRCYTVNTANHMKPQQCLLGHSFKEITTQSPQQCCLICSKDPKCRSFNLYGKTCQLNNAALSQTGTADVGNDINCVYYDYSE